MQVKKLGSGVIEEETVEGWDGMDDGRSEGEWLGSYLPKLSLAT